MLIAAQGVLHNKCIIFLDVLGINRISILAILFSYRVFSPLAEGVA